VSAIRTRAVRDGDDYVIDGQKMWLTNGGSSSLVAVLVKTDEGTDSVYRNMTAFLVEKAPGFGEVDAGLTIPGKIEKMGYKGVDTTELLFHAYRIPADRILGKRPAVAFTR
jgi:alkylation response protein AidB-like acyl-CoA dehydrogenase